MAGFDGIDDDLIRNIQANLSHTKVKKPGTRYFRYDPEQRKVVEVDRPNVVVNHSMFPYASSAMPTVDIQNPDEVESAVAQCRAFGVTPEFDSEGRFNITSTKQHDAISKAMGLKTGRDGYGHTDEAGRFHNSGRRRADEVAEGRQKVRKAINELESMPEDVGYDQISDTLKEYDIAPNDSNTG